MKRTVIAVAAMVLGAAIGSAALAQTPGAPGYPPRYPHVSPFLARPLAPNQSVQNMGRYVNQPYTQPAYPVPPPIYRKPPPRWAPGGYWRGTPNGVAAREAAPPSGNGYPQQHPAIPPPRFGPNPQMANNPRYQPRPGPGQYPQSNPAAPGAGPSGTYRMGRGGPEYPPQSGAAGAAVPSTARSFDRTPWAMAQHRHPPVTTANNAPAGKHPQPAPTPGADRKHRPASR